MSIQAENSTGPTGFVSPWDDATFDLMVEKFDTFQFGNALKRRQDRIGGIWASEYLPGLFPTGGFLNAAAALSSRGVRYSSLEEASSWEAVKETWITSGIAEEELKPFSFALSHVPLTTEQALELGDFLINKRLVSGTLARRFAHNPVFKDEDLYATMLGLDSDAERSLHYSRFKRSFVSSRYAVPSIVRRVLPIVRTPDGNDQAALNLTSKNPALHQLHGTFVDAADEGYMNDFDARGPAMVAKDVLPTLEAELQTLSTRTSADIKENLNSARFRTLRLLYLVSSTREVRSSLTAVQEAQIVRDLGRIYFPQIMNSEDLLTRSTNNTAILALPYVSRYINGELKGNGVDTDGIPLNWLLELISE